MTDPITPAPEAPVATPATPAPAPLPTPVAAAPAPAPIPAPVPVPASVAATPAPAPVASATPAADKPSAAEHAVRVFAAAEFAALTDDQKTIVKAAAGDDPSEQLKAISIVKAMAPKTAPAPAPLPIPAPANSAPPPAAPAATSSAPVDVKSEYQRLQNVNPLAAANYLLNNSQQYFKQP